jgi:zinc protease
MNYVLGGAFGNRINMNLREAKGYTYGARSNFRRHHARALRGLVRGQDRRHQGDRWWRSSRSSTPSARASRTRGGLRARLAGAGHQPPSTRSVNALGGLLDNVSRYGWPDNYPSQRLQFLSAVDKAQLEDLAKRYVHPDTLHVLVVGDASKVREGLASLGYPLIELDIDGNPLPQG